MSALLEVENVRVDFNTQRGVVQALRGVSFSVDPGESVAIVGASGSGKTVLSRSLLGLVDEPGVVSGSIVFDGQQVVGAPESRLRAIRGLGMAMVFQDALDGLNPVYTIGSQVMEILTVRMNMSRADARREALRLMQEVDIPNAEGRFHDHPHQFSGGMRQRICIALAVGLRPKILIADEPTTALDVTVQAGILQLIRRLQEEIGMGLIFVTHDLAVAQQISERTLVMFNGNIVEQGRTREVFRHPTHRYTQALLASHPAHARSWRDLEPMPDSFVLES